MEVKVRHKDIFGISHHVDHLKEVKSGSQQHESVTGTVLHHQCISVCLCVHPKTLLGAEIVFSVNEVTEVVKMKRRQQNKVNSVNIRGTSTSWRADLALLLTQSKRHELIQQMGDPHPG